MIYRQQNPSVNHEELSFHQKTLSYLARSVVHAKLVVTAKKQWFI